MCSICRNKNCKYQFGKDQWGPPSSEYVTYVLPESELTFLESVRVAEDQLAKRITSAFALPPGTFGKKPNEKKKKKER